MKRFVIILIAACILIVLFVAAIPGIVNAYPAGGSSMNSALSSPLAYPSPIDCLLPVPYPDPILDPYPDPILESKCAYMPFLCK